MSLTVGGGLMSSSSVCISFALFVVYFVFSSLVACGKKLLWNLAVLLRRLRNLFPESSSENSPWWGWELSLLML